MIEKIISGGQIGADNAGLIAAEILKIPTGGFAPKNYMTMRGSNPLLKKYGLIEIDGGYRKRTWMNVEYSDGTIRFATNFHSPGEICTMNAIKNYKRPHIDVPMDKFTGKIENPDEIRDAVIVWINTHNIKILNVAGNTGADEKEIVDFLIMLVKRHFYMEI
jgi:hypothetical protein